jgi:hypothetical protein
MMQDPPALPEVNLVFATPRKLPRAVSLKGRVVVVDIAFASEASGGGFEKVTRRFIEDLGPRLAAWVDHHDHAQHARYAGDDRFILSTKAEHGACPEMIDSALVRRVGTIHTIVCHTDFDGLASAAKWLRGGIEPYEGCDDDARAIDTRMGEPSPTGVTIDRALRARPSDQGLFGVVVRHLGSGLQDGSLWAPIRQAASELRAVEETTRKLALGYARFAPGVAVVDVTHRTGRVDKTLLLMMGQQRETIAMVVDADTISLATRFDSGIDLLALLRLSGGMPTRVSVPRKRLADVCHALGLEHADVDALLGGSHGS